MILGSNKDDTFLYEGERRIEEPVSGCRAPDRVRAIESLHAEPYRPLLLHLTLQAPNDIEFSGERKRVGCNEGLDAGYGFACGNMSDARAASESPRTGKPDRHALTPRSVGSRPMKGASDVAGSSQELGMAMVDSSSDAETGWLRPCSFRVTASQPPDARNCRARCAAGNASCSANDIKLSGERSESAAARC